jgi:hypothetical protein
MSEVSEVDLGGVTEAASEDNGSVATRRFVRE